MSRLGPETHRMHKIDVILPIYNESAMIGSVFSRVSVFSQKHPEFHFIFVDDGSDDDTADQVESRLAAQDSPAIELVRSPMNLGKGNAIRRGIATSTAPLIGFTDGDLAYPLEDHMTPLLEGLSTSDVVIGSRSLDPRQQENIQFKRRLMGRLFNMIVRLFLGLPYRDTQAGLKGFRRPVAQRIVDLGRIENFAFDAEALYIATRSGCTISEIPARVSSRHSYIGSTMNLILDPIKMFASIIWIRVVHMGRRFSSVPHVDNDPPHEQAELEKPAGELHGSRDHAHAGR
ncbi:MAG: glycosyl transferase [Phycisphaerae bacterium]|nr:glycosyl transferase [Phycisphaerae bacterium]